MKVIIIKDYKNYKTNEIVEVKDGFAKNFLINKGYALPYNNLTSKLQAKKIEDLKTKKIEHEANLMKLKEKIESLKLEFSIKGKGVKLYESITRKQIKEELAKHDIKVQTFEIENVKIQSLGVNLVKINLSKEIEANLNIIVNLDETRK
ncbi:MAG: 50S ribosomal protein L9 [Mycoplasma sp.]|nr:50S ribosomal protein L9 [Mycoplasma sp.]